MESESNVVQCERMEKREPKPARLFEKLTAHKVDGSQTDLLDIIIVDEPGPGGAHHEYMCYWPDSDARLRSHTIKFQKGGIKEVGTNGLTHEALLAIVLHRLECFQKGKYPSEENAKAAEHVREALHCLKMRTIARIARGVEGVQKA